MIKFYLSGGTNNSDSSLSIGGLPSTYPAPVGLNAIFNKVSKDELTNGSLLYRCIYIKNDSNSNIEDINFDVVQPELRTNFSYGFDLFNEIQTLTFSGTPLSGTFELVYQTIINNLIVSQNTYPITYDSSFVVTAANIQNALNDLTYLDTVSVSGTNQNNFQVTFENKDGFRSQQLLGVSNFNVLGSTGIIFNRVVSGSPINQVAVNVGFENQSPQNVSFTNSTLSLPAFRPGDSAGIWLRRGVPSGTVGTTQDTDTAKILVSFNGSL